MEYQLIPDDAYQFLPSEPEEKLAYLARVAQANLNKFLAEDTSGDFSTEVRQQFVETMRAVAEALYIDGLPTARDTADLTAYEEYRLTSMRLSALITKVRLQSDLVPRPFSVKLGRVTKARIRQEAEHLKLYIEESDLPGQKRKKLLDHVRTLFAELDRERLSFGQITAITAAIATTFGGGTAAIAKAPEAYRAITIILGAIGEDKDKEEAERERLSPLPKALPPPVVAPRAPKGFADDLDDDVPF